MGFLKRSSKEKSRETNGVNKQSSFESLTEDQLEAHLAVWRYGNFELTNAIRPAYNLEVVPRCGYRHDVFRDRETGVDIPVIMASASRTELFDLFLDLLDPLGDCVDVVLESSHDRVERNENSHDDLYREYIDLPILKSTLYDFEENLLNDGCSGIAVLNPRLPLEVQFDEHKLLIMYGQDVHLFESILADYNIPCQEEIRFITEAEHVHSSSEELHQEFEQLKYRLGIEDYQMEAW